MSSLTLYDYNVIYDPANTAINITRYVETLRLVDIGTGEIRNAHLRLNAEFGAFITNTTNGETPIIQEFDKIEITVTAENNSNIRVIYEVDIIHPTKDGVQGTVLPVDLLGTERHLQQLLFSDQFYFKSGFYVAQQICKIYNLHKGSTQPTIYGHNDAYPTGFNNLPKWTANDYLFNIREENVYDGLVYVGDRLGSSVASGGAGDFFEVYFATATGNNTLDFMAFPSGDRPDVNVIPNIKNSISVNAAEQENITESTRSTISGTWGAKGSGILPYQNSNFVGALEAWKLFPSYIIGEHPQGSIIAIPNTEDSQGDWYHYKANKKTNMAPPVPPSQSNADWDAHTFVDFLTNIGAATGYSKWTNGKSNEWKSNGSKTDGTQNTDPPTFDSLSMWDCNQVVIDGTFSRTWADTRATSPDNIPSKFKRNGGVYRGFRVLVNGQGTSDFAGFDNKIIQWDGTQWLIFKNPETSNMVGIDDEGRIYQYNIASAPNVWSDISGGLSQGNECYHPVWAIYNSQGYNHKNNGTGNFGLHSAVTHEFRYDKNDIDQALFNEPQYYRMWAGFCFRVPFPFNSDNSNSIGEEYGNSDSREPATIDTNNMSLTSQGQTGFNNSGAEDLGPLDTISFNVKMEYRTNKDGSGALVDVGNFDFRCTLYDIDDNVVIQDFTIPFNNQFEEISLPISGFETYKARAPWSFGAIGQNVFLNELQVLDSFRWRNIKKISVHWLGPYDDQGRYHPVSQFNFIFPSILDFLLGLPSDGYNVKLSVDSFQFRKPLLSVSAPVTDRPLMIDFFNEPFISNKYQNDQANQANLEIANFRHREYTITTQMRFDVPYGGSFFLEDQDIVNVAERTVDDLGAWQSAQNYNTGESDVAYNGIGYRCIKSHRSGATNRPPNSTFWEVLPSPIPHTIKLVNKRSEHTIDKIPSGPGGAFTTITGVKRI